MSRIAGYGRNKGETYPERGGAGGSAGAIVPLARQRFIDGDTVQTGLNGSVANPYATIAQFMAARGNDSAEDAGANFVGWIMPTEGGYTGGAAFPAYASTELRADSFSILPASGVFITGNVTWANVSGAFAATLAVAAMHNVSVTGNVTITDEVETPASNFIFGGDEIGQFSASISGDVDASATVRLNTFFLNNAAVLGDINLGTGDDSANLAGFGSTIGGDILAGGLSLLQCNIGAGTISLAPGGNASFIGCTFSPSVPTLLTAVGGATFDGPSWRSFREAGGSRTVLTVILVIGGYNGGPVEGAALTGAATSVALNGTGATAGFTGSDSGNHYSCASATPTSVTLLTGGGERDGDTLLITKTNLGANALAVINGGTGGGTIGTVPANNRGFVLAQFSAVAGAWIFHEGGALAA